jgi:hypothetical protein
MCFERQVCLPGRSTSKSRASRPSGARDTRAGDTRTGDTRTGDTRTRDTRHTHMCLADSRTHTRDTLAYSPTHAALTSTSTASPARACPSSPSGVCRPTIRTSRHCVVCCVSQLNVLACAGTTPLITLITLIRDNALRRATYHPVMINNARSGWE